jgi:hypothetical protein
MVQVSPHLFLSTHYASEEMANDTAHGLRGMRYQEQGLADPLSGMSPDAFGQLDGLQQMLGAAGYRTLEIVENVPQHPHGPIVNLITSRSTGLPEEPALLIKEHKTRGNHAISDTPKTMQNW